MADYNFLTVWKFDAPLEMVYNTVHNADNYHVWWRGQSPVETISQGNALGVGAVKRFRTRSILPYTLTYTGTVHEVIPLKRVVGTTVGELEGCGTWLFGEENGQAIIKYSWVVRTNSRLMNFLAPVFKPIFEWNHDVVMRWGGRGLANYIGCRFIE
ncbi:MAG TPA: SRPBCC family protein [Chitinophagales bacterium]|nr:SRPBCC family protein [Chitinophagales bacterium]